MHCSICTCTGTHRTINCVVDLLGATVKEMDIKGKYCIEIVLAPPKFGSKSKNKDKNYIFQVEKEHDRPKWLEALKRASTRHKAMSFEMGEGGTPTDGDVVPHNNPMHAQGSPSSPRSQQAQSTASEGDEDEDATISGVRTLSSASFRMSSVGATDKEGYLLNKSPALMKGWQKRYFVTNSVTGDIDYYRSVSAIFDSTLEGFQLSSSFNHNQSLPFLLLY